MVVDKMKVVNKGIPINKSVGLKSKMYFMFSDDGKGSNTAKVVNITTEFNEFKETLFNKKVVRHKIKRNQNKKHKLGTYGINKILLLCFDDASFVLNDGIHALNNFHKDLKNRFSQMMVKKKRFKKIFTNDQRFTQLKGAHK